MFCSVATGNGAGNLAVNHHDDHTKSACVQFAEHNHHNLARQRAAVEDPEHDDDNVG